MDEAWDLEFTERKPLDVTKETELAIGGEKSFRTVYQCVLVHAADRNQSASRDGKQVTLIKQVSNPDLNQRLHFAALHVHIL